jgi:hypothetical protein
MGIKYCYGKSMVGLEDVGCYIKFEKKYQLGRLALND